jgi:hypothetical protein
MTVIRAYANEAFGKWPQAPAGIGLGVDITVLQKFLSKGTSVLRAYRRV